MTSMERRAFVESQKEKYKPGMRIHLIHMSDDPRPVPDGAEGTVTSVDDMGQIHVSWETGGGLAISQEYGDKFEIINELYLIKTNFCWDGDRWSAKVINEKEYRQLKTALDYCVAKKVIVPVSVNEMDEAELFCYEDLIKCTPIEEEEVNTLKKFEIFPNTDYIDFLEKAILAAYADSTK